MKRLSAVGLAVAGLVLSPLTLLSGPAQAELPAAPGSYGRSVVPVEAEHPTLNLAADTATRVEQWLRTPDGAAQRRTGATAGATPPVGTKRMWPAADFETGVDYMKEYTLRGVGDSIEVWVASGTDGTSSGIEMRPGDCRAKLPNYTTITAQSRPPPTQEACTPTAAAVAPARTSPRRGPPATTTMNTPCIRPRISSGA